jgi:CheY-like chemotaxis protein
MPQIVCSLPSKSWLASEVNIIDFLTKPVLSESLLQSVKQCGDFRRVLVADDDRGFCQLVERILHSDNSTTVVHFAYTGSEVLDYINATPPDILLLDLTIPEVNGSEILAYMNDRPYLAPIPVILVTGVNYGEEMLREHQGRLTILQADGLRPAQVMRYLKAILAN